MIYLCKGDDFVSTNDDKLLKKHHRDTLFSHLFSEPKYFLQLLYECRGHPVDLEEQDIHEFRVDSKYVKRSWRNDVSFITSDNRLIILVEHQSTICPNLALRLLFYYIELVQMWIKISNISFYGSNPIPPLPAPEFYVVYNGKRKLAKTKSTFNLEGISVNISVEVNIIDIRFGSLKSKTSTDNALAGYSFFYKVFDETLKKGKNGDEAFKHARSMCIKHGYLKGIIEKGSMVMDYKRYFFDYEVQVMEQMKSEAREEGLAEGREEGMQQGIQEGMQQGILKFAELIKAGLSVEEALSRIQNEYSVAV